MVCVYVCVCVCVCVFVCVYCVYVSLYVLSPSPAHFLVSSLVTTEIVGDLNSKRPQQP